MIDNIFSKKKISKKILNIYQSLLNDNKLNSEKQIIKMLLHLFYYDLSHERLNEEDISKFNKKINESYNKLSINKILLKWKNFIINKNKNRKDILTLNSSYNSFLEYIINSIEDCNDSIEIYDFILFLLKHNRIKIDVNIIKQVNDKIKNINDTFLYLSFNLAILHLFILNEYQGDNSSIIYA